MKKLFTITLILGIFQAFGQQEAEASKKISDQFQKSYNADKFEEIFNTFSSEMKAALPLEATKTFLGGLKTEVGNMEQLEFTGYKSGFALYKTTFEKGVLLVQLAGNKDLEIAGLLVKAYVPDRTAKMDRNSTGLILPFNEEWSVFWGGDTEEQNYHVAHKGQKNAFDLVIRDENNKSHKSNGSKNEDYFAFGKELIAPCDAEVVLAVDGITDNIPGEMNALYVPGNTVVLKTANNEFLFFAHFKQNSIKVKLGDNVKQGQVLGFCGNSGNSSEPHLHFHIQDGPDLNTAIGVKCYFENILVNGEYNVDYSPVKGEKIKNE